MTRLVFTHLLNTYARSALIWIAIGLTAISQFISKILVPITLAKWISSYVSGSASDSFGLTKIGLLYTCAIIIGIAGDYIFVKRSDALYERLVGRFYDIAMCQNVDFFREEKSGSLAALFRNLLDGTINLFRILRVDAIPLTIATLGSIVTLYFYSGLAALVFALAIAGRGCISWLSIVKVKPFRRQAIAAYNELSGRMADQLAQLPVVRASGNYQLNKKRITDLASIEGQLFWIRHQASTRYEFLANSMVALCFVGIFAIAFYRETSDILHLEMAILAPVLILQGMQAAQSVGELQQRLSERWEHVATSLQKFPISNTGEVKRSVGGAPSNGEIEFDDVSFSYEGRVQRQVLSNVKLKITNGQHVAVVGPNGAGKSTLINLLMRFDRPKAGNIFYSGRNVCEWEELSFYRSISYVPQEPKLFNETVLDNIKFFEPDVSSSRLAKVSEVLLLDVLEKELNRGFATSAGELGSQLSGGQKQKVALARALLRDANLYIFDEATSALAADASSELVRNIRRFLQHKTVIFVTHSPDIASTFPTTLEIGRGKFVLSSVVDERQYALDLRERLLRDESP